MYTYIGFQNKVELSEENTFLLNFKIKDPRQQWLYIFRHCGYSVKMYSLLKYGIIQIKNT